MEEDMMFQEITKLLMTTPTLEAYHIIHCSVWSSKGPERIIKHIEEAVAKYIVSHPFLNLWFGAVSKLQSEMKKKSLLFRQR